MPSHPIRLHGEVLCIPRCFQIHRPFSLANTTVRVDGETEFLSFYESLQDVFLLTTNWEIGYGFSCWLPSFKVRAEVPGSGKERGTVEDGSVGFLEG